MSASELGGEAQTWLGNSKLGGIQQGRMLSAKNESNLFSSKFQPYYRSRKNYYLALGAILQLFCAAMVILLGGISALYFLAISLFVFAGSTLIANIACHLLRARLEGGSLPFGGVGQYYTIVTTLIFASLLVGCGQADYPGIVSIFLFMAGLALIILNASQPAFGAGHARLQILILVLANIVMLSSMALTFQLIGLAVSSLVGWIALVLINDSVEAKGQVDRLTQYLSEQQRINHALRNLDPLTGLLNRFVMTEIVDHICQQQVEHDEVASHESKMEVEIGCGLLWINLDRFAVVNRAFGTELGDMILCEIASRLQQLAGEEMVVARYGCDEFLLAIPDCDRIKLVRIASRAAEIIARPVNVNSRTIWLSAAIGAAMSSEETIADILFNHANIAMQEAKADGLDNIHMFHPAMLDKVKRRYQIERELADAALQDEIELVYQPVFDLKRGEIIAFEALARWSNANIGRIGPDEFIPIAEQNGTIDIITDLVASAAIREARNWPEHIRLNLNLSPILLERQGIVERIAFYACRSRVSPDRITIELTEEAIISGHKNVEANIDKLKTYGFQLSIDDFGTGYSSLEYLNRVPVNSIKLDKSFARQITSDTKTCSIIRSVISLCNMLELVLVVEGIENYEQLQYVASHQCHMVQGYYFSEPVRASKIKALLCKDFSHWLDEVKQNPLKLSDPVPLQIY